MMRTLTCFLNTQNFMNYGKNQWQQHIFMNYKISISENSNCNEFAKTLFQYNETSM